MKQSERFCFRQVILVLLGKMNKRDYKEEKGCKNIFTILSENDKIYQ